MPPIQVSPDQFAVVLDGMLKADGPWRVRALPCPATQAVQVGPEVLRRVLPGVPGRARANRPIFGSGLVSLRGAGTGVKMAVVPPVTSFFLWCG